MKKVFIITDKLNGKTRYNFAHVYNKHIIASTRQGYSRRTDCEKVYENNFLPGAEKVYVTRSEFNKIMKFKSNG